MEEILDNIVSIKDEVRKKLFEKFECSINSESFKFPIFSERLKLEEVSFLGGISMLANNEEFNKLIKKYEYLNFLISSINNFRKINEEED